MSEAGSHGQPARLKAEVDGICVHLITQFRDLVGSITELYEMDSRLARVVQERIHAVEPELGQLFEQVKIRFESVLLLDDEDIALLLKALNLDRLSLALVGASEEVRNQFFRNLPSQSVARIKDDIQRLGPVRESSVNLARQEVIEAVRVLERGHAIRYGGYGHEDTWLMG